MAATNACASAGPIVVPKNWLIVCRLTGIEYTRPPDVALTLWLYGRISPNRLMYSHTWSHWVWKMCGP